MYRYGRGKGLALADVRDESTPIRYNQRLKE